MIESEIAILSSVSHPNIIQLEEVFDFPAEKYLIMEYVQVHVIVYKQLSRTVFHLSMPFQSNIKANTESTGKIVFGSRDNNYRQIGDKSELLTRQTPYVSIPGPCIRVRMLSSLAF